MRLIEVQPREILERWDWLRDGLEQVKASGPPEACPWEPSDVCIALHARNAVLFLIDDVGFVVLQVNRCSYEQVMFVWALWAKTNSMWRVYRDVMTELEAMARAAGLTRIRMHSPREEWKALNLFVPVSTIFEREVGK